MKNSYAKREFILLALLTFLLIVTSSKAPATSKEEVSKKEEEYYAQERKRMVEVQIASRGVKDPRVLQAMGSVPRHLFVPEELRHLSYEDGPLPIGSGQTISQPYIVALMTELLRLKPEDRVLEIGTGSGYQAAVLSEIVSEVFTMEINKDLGERARERLEALGYTKIKVIIGDGYKGLPDAAPFDAIIVTAAAPHIPQPLVEQLKPGGRMVIPLGRPYQTQILTLVIKEKRGITRDEIAPVLFVPLVRER